MPTLLDTNVYLFAMRSEEGAAFFESRFLPLVFQTSLADAAIERLKQLEPISSCISPIRPDSHSLVAHLRN